jgi:hypothetical protein
VGPLQLRLQLSSVASRGRTSRGFTSRGRTSRGVHQVSVHQGAYIRGAYIKEAFIKGHHQGGVHQGGVHQGGGTSRELDQGGRYIKRLTPTMTPHWYNHLYSCDRVRVQGYSSILVSSISSWVRLLTNQPSTLAHFTLMDTSWIDHNKKCRAKTPTKFFWDIDWCQSWFRTSKRSEVMCDLSPFCIIVTMYLYHRYPSTIPILLVTQHICQGKRCPLHLLLINLSLQYRYRMWRCRWRCPTCQLLSCCVAGSAPWYTCSSPVASLHSHIVPLFSFPLPEHLCSLPLSFVSPLTLTSSLARAGGTCCLV